MTFKGRKYIRFIYPHPKRFIIYLLTSGHTQTISRQAGGGGGVAKCLCYYINLGNKLVYGGGRGGQKSAKSCLRSLCMAPNVYTLDDIPSCRSKQLVHSIIKWLEVPKYFTFNNALFNQFLFLYL